MDVHKRESQACVLGDEGEGEAVLEQSIRTDRARFAMVLGARPRSRCPADRERYVPAR